MTDPVEAMRALAGQFGQQGAPMKALERLLTTYQQRRHEANAGVVVAGEGASSPSPGSVIASRVGLVGLGMIPGVGAFTGALDATQVAAGAEQLKGVLSARFRSHEDVQLVLSPVQALTPVFLQELAEIAQRRSWVVLFFDTYERTGPALDTWLRDLLVSDRYGELPANVLVVLAGQGRLDAQCWGDWLDLVTDLPLDVFTETEARQLLAAKGVTDEHVIEVVLRLSGRLPLLVSTLAESQPAGAAEVGDPSGTAVERFLKWETSPARRAAALACALPQELDEDVYRAAVDDSEARELFGWLRSMPFVTDRAGRCHYHEVVRTAMLRLQRQQSPARWHQQHTRLADTFAEWRRRLACDGGDRAARWRDERWRGHRFQETYHRLCADPDRALAPALRELLDAWSHGTATTRRWAQMLVRAGQDADAREVREWGERVVAAMGEPQPAVAVMTLLLAGTVLDRPGRARAHRHRGIGHHAAGRHDLAQAEFDRSVELDPDQPRALHSRARALVVGQRFEEALADLDRTLELDPDFAAAHATRGETRRLMGRHQEALADFDRAVELDPAHSWAVGHRGETLRELGRHEEALADFDRAVALDPDYVWAHTARGLLHREAGRYEEALAAYGRALELDPDYHWAAAMRAQVHRLTGRHREALADLDRVIELAPDHAWAHAARGDVHRLAGRHQEAVADFDRALALEPGTPGVLALRGHVHLAAGRHPEALADFDRVVELDPGSDWAVAQRGEAHRVTGRYPEALADFDRVVGLDSGRAWIADSRGRTQQALGQYREALSDYDRAVRLDPGAPLHAAHRGDAHRLLGEYEAALADYGRALELDPHGHPWILAARGLTHRLLDRYAEALADLDRAIAAAPANGWYHYEKAVVLHALGRRPEGDTLLTRAVALLHPGRAVADLGNLVLARAALADPPGAVRALESFLCLTPPPGRIAELRIALGTLARTVPPAADHAAALQHRLPPTPDR
ncbi:tetratricopeptide repeat protein [Kitasatospora sp. NPDC059646]|uniref:tetratricopeptide repeat protein n=1 Tax=Kitasatospora sp. NPDC059646 TaxID=3346893 RepID=UPI0036BC2FC4